ncbi:MBL fold metallo-hydrolase [Phreatobacter stygius]|uniref:MBL fold metallo-hydrolase n=1 Tax=Phreatobacter stygius TaxID=1940610 RepID=A0A4D7BC50_9HYPH|nr:MBL fold metallo-hydrolase [Phreatobacter stygius]QCI68360.1 MBL fold metallo-hydrolase [Phreatobacter stygius]
MHDFFRRRDGGPFKIPPLMYALLIEGEDGEFVLFDAVDAQFFDQTYAPGYRIAPGNWRSRVNRAPVYAVEVHARGGTPAAIDWLKRHPLGGLPEWSQIELDPDPNGAADVYDTIAGPPQRARISVRPLSRRRVKALERATDLTPDIRPEAEIERALPTSAIDQVFVLDVGQGAANALVTSAGEVVAYVDLGAGVLRDVGTWPNSMGGLCLCHQPKVILTHWHYDHFQAANIYPAAQKLTWIAPLQRLGPGPQSLMASSITRAGGALMIWNGHGILSTSQIALERCTGPTGNQNRTGISVWVWGPVGKDPILLPGDAGYADVPTLAAGKAIGAFAVAHHGGRAPGVAPARPGASTPRAALSYGHKNSYGHPLTPSLTGLTASGWHIGHPAAGKDERRTEDRPGGAGGSGLGHIRLNWAGGSSSAHSCACGCTLDPTQ